jgi:hypothetical protein
MFFAGLASGFADAQTKDRAVQAQIDEQNAQRENAALMHLSTIPGDENADIRAAAVTGLLDQKRRPGQTLMSRFMNQTQENPMFPTIRGLMGQQVSQPGATTTRPAEPGPSTMQPPGTAATPPPGGELGIPQTSLGAAHDVLPQAPASSQQISTQGPPTTRPRRIPSGPETAGMTTFEQSRGHLLGVLNAAGATGADPTMMMYAEAHVLGVPMSHADDEQGNRTFMMGTLPIGVAKGVAAAKGPEAKVKTEATNILSTAPPGTTLADATTQARQGEAAATSAKQQTAVSGATSAAAKAETAEPLAQAKLTIAQAGAAVAPEMAAARLAASKQTTATGLAREHFLAAETTAEWQRVNGTMPMSPSQRINAARELLGNNPSISAGDIGRLADTLAQTQGQGGAGRAAAPPPTAAPAVGVGAPRTTQPPRTATPPPAGGVSGALDRTNLGATAKNFKQYSTAGRQTITALDTVGAMLPKIEATIRGAGLADSNNPLPEKISSALYQMGISPGDDMEALLQNAGMAKGYGLRGLLGGRSNQQLQGIYGQHLLDQGDSPKLMLQKIHTLQANLPDIRAAVDDAESQGVGQKRKGAAAAAPPGGGSATQQKPIPGIPGGIAESTDGGTTWHRVK